MKKKVTLRSLASELGIAPATVMRALNGSGQVRPELRKKIIALAADMGYKLPDHRTGNIGIITSAVSFSGYLELLLQSLYHDLVKSGFKVWIVPDSNIDSVRDFLFDGLISTVWNDGFEKYFPKDHCLPLVTINAMNNPGENVYAVSSDEKKGIRLGLEYLRRSGCRKIAFFTTPGANNRNRNDRIQTFREFCTEYSMPYEGFLVNSVSFEIQSQVSDVLDMGSDAIFCASEGYALEIYHALHRSGKRIPEDISVIGLDNFRVSQYLYPELTAIGQDFKALSREAVNMLIKLMNGESVTSSVLVPYTFIERNSVRKKT